MEWGDSMKKLLHQIATLLLVLAFFISFGILKTVSAGSSATGTASVTVQAQVTITATEVLSFGQVRPGDTAGTVVVDTQNNRTAGGGTEVRAGNPPFSRAEFTVTGSPDVGYSIVLASDVALHDQGGNNLTLMVTNLVAFSVNRFDLGEGTTEGKFGFISGEDMVFVGGTLQVPANAKNGKYEGDVMLTINY